MKGKLNFVLGFVLGAAIFGGATAVAAGVLANPTTSRVLVDGTEVHAEAYNINGSNYFKLRDIAQAVDFSVVWDGTGNRILIDTARGYTPNEALADSLPVQVQPPTRTAAAAEMIAEVVRLTNIERANNGLNPLTAADDLTEIAMIKSQDMADNGYLGHDSPTFGRTRNLMDTDVWARYMGENCARGSRTPEAVVRGWMNSPSHRATILNDEATHIGVGVARDSNGVYLWTQFFAIAR
jgi:uncharacterized protein YkwD